jgi:hypothetical protein
MKLIFEQLERLADKIENDRDVIDPDTVIKNIWRRDPFRWARDRLRVPLKRWESYDFERYRAHQWDGTREPLYTAAKSIANGYNVAVTSATGTGKTFLGALMVFWFLDCFEGAQVITAAPKRDQLTLHIWKEIGRLWPYFQKLHPKASLDTLRIRMRPSRDDWGAVGFICGVAADEDVAGRARGFHAEHMLFIIEETPGVHPAILAAFEFTCTAPHNLRLFFGNPDNEYDALAQVSKDPGVVAIRASALDHPNIVCNDANRVPGATSTLTIDTWREKFGEDSPLFQSRARGIPPAQSRHALIRREWVIAAMKAPDHLRADLMRRGNGAAALGVDCAQSEAGDKSCYARGIGNVCVEIVSMHTPDNSIWARQHVWPFIESGMVRARRVGVDSVGVGTGVLNELRRLGGRGIVALNAGEGPWEEVMEITKDRDETFNNLRSQMWWQLRKDLQRGLIALPYDEELLEDLVAVRWEAKNGKIVVEPKADVKLRLPQGRSTDKGDAIMQWNWVRQFNRTATFGGSDDAIAATSGLVAF